MNRSSSSRAGLALIGVTSLVLAATGAPASAAPALTMTLSSTTGPGGGATIVGSVTANSVTPVPFPAGTNPTVQFQYVGTTAASSACSASAKVVSPIVVSNLLTTAGTLTVNPAAVKRISTTKIVFQVPSSPYPVNDANGNPSTVNPNGLVLMGGQTSSRWSVCVYDSDNVTTSTLLATATYTLAIKPTITSILPASSPAGGGQTITVNGTGFAATSVATTATAGGVALTNVKVAANGNSFTATTGPRAAGDGLPVVVNAPGGTVSSLDPDNNSQTNDPPIPFSYTNGISITPNQAAAGTQVTIDVIGAGFSSLTFDAGAAPIGSGAHVFLVKDAYVANSNRGVAECTGVSVIRDTELICTLDLAADQLNPANSATMPGVAIAEGAYVLTVVADGGTGAGGSANPTIVSSGATFTVGPY
ncbi:IPT/TIG domain-containing protein [Actinoplanes sp. LDG1-06]|uniref:IPT/TIG domain-containing protein n=1 Tax=Paractinoplanes ovalisporus TaxID=2810368 RepID=A0ABS2AQI0_9ACTN|nr:IPT/TIG domain-containing protein [Actinoplanes ovalisporus]MBM2621593.1 IPT/TIG domain-containing protein [Actinoplanes ovalisporus]